MLFVNFQKLVQNELDRARSKHPGEQRNLHEAYAVILEEVDEFWDLVKSQKPDKGKVLEELVQIAAMCQRAAEDVIGCEKGCFFNAACNLENYTVSSIGINA